ncbi:NAD kinase 2, mitochondrial [Eumeta japonica]|uniref:NAD(+) kinase n=1 Tax=Eumeta variegata TaxID=151549 RepID=A0A4C1W0J4_EUMVA|nr:NAD kinase 2, mitochondrial [Eumeta japonica]
MPRHVNNPVYSAPIDVSYQNALNLYNHEQLSEQQLERALKKRGTNYDELVANHRNQKQFEMGVACSLEAMGCEVQMATRLSYNNDLLNWCDVVMPCGGDGTFLLAASRVRDCNKPVIGFNSAPHRSVGRLCLPTWCSRDVPGAVAALREGRFRWMRRTRIRTTIRCCSQIEDSIAPLDLHTLQFSRYPAVSNEDFRFQPRVVCAEQNGSSQETATTMKVLPVLALNEVFLGESVTSRVSQMQLQINNSGKWNHTKSSGVCVTTGTGSTSWHFSINCLRTHSVLELMRILQGEFGVTLDTSLEKAREVAERYNQRLMFPPDSMQLAYSVREYITFEEWPTPRGLRVRDSASSIRVRSHCVDAGLVIDGGISYPFNDGTEALLEVHPEDSLMTVHMDDQLHH